MLYELSVNISSVAFIMLKRFPFVPSLSISFRKCVENELQATEENWKQERKSAPGKST